ncbi:MAG: arsenate reductase ArsC [candidate division KSB1 bacterium]|nr:arsenate reductase ArsC [candidate division KSB1 bacterium]
MTRILVICTHNSARSQMAEGFFRHYGGDTIEVHSAGTQPSVVHPLAIKAMQEVGIDISGQRSKSVEEFRGQIFDVVITVCDSAQETCPFFPGKKVIHHSFPDPAEATGPEDEQLAVFRQVRDQIKQWVRSFLKNETRRLNVTDSVKKSAP